jgi:hypothetical protein
MYQQHKCRLRQAVGMLAQFIGTFECSHPATAAAAQKAAAAPLSSNHLSASNHVLMLCILLCVHAACRCCFICRCCAVPCCHGPWLASRSAARHWHCSRWVGPRDLCHMHMYV